MCFACCVCFMCVSKLVWVVDVLRVPCRSLLCIVLCLCWFVFVLEFYGLFVVVVCCYVLGMCLVVVGVSCVCPCLCLSLLGICAFALLGCCCVFELLLFVAA